MKANEQNNPYCKNTFENVIKISLLLLCRTQTWLKYLCITQ